MDAYVGNTSVFDAQIAEDFSEISVLFPGSDISKLHGVRTRFRIQMALHAMDRIILFNLPRLLSEQGTSMIERLKFEMIYT